MNSVVYGLRIGRLLNSYAWSMDDYITEFLRGLGSSLCVQIGSASVLRLDPQMPLNRPEKYELQPLSSDHPSRITAPWELIGPRSKLNLKTLSVLSRKSQVSCSPRGDSACNPCLTVYAL